MLNSMKKMALKTVCLFQEAQQYDEIHGVLQNKVTDLC